MLLLRWLLRIVAAIVLLILLLIIALQFTAVQTYVARTATAVLSKHTNTEITVERVGIRLPKTISVHNLYAEDNQGDTLIYIHELRVNARMFALFRNNIHIKNITLSDATVNITRLEPDSLFNLDYLLMAFSSDPGKTAEDPTQKPSETAMDDKNPAAPMAFALESINLNNIQVRFADHHAGIDLRLRLGKFKTGFDAIDPGQMLFKLGQTRLSDVSVLLSMHEATMVEKEVEKNDGTMPELGISGLVLENVSINIFDDKDFSVTTNLSYLETKPRKLDLQNMIFDLERFFVDGLVAEIITPTSAADDDVDYERFSSAGTLNPASGHPQGLSNREYQLQRSQSPEQDMPKNAPVKKQPAFRWHKIMPVSLMADDLRLNNLSLTMHEANAHLKAANGSQGDAGVQVSDVMFLMQDMLVTPDSIAARMMELGGKDAGGLELLSFSAGLALGRGARIDDLKLKTAETRFTANMTTTMPVLDFEWPPAPHHHFNISLQDGFLGNDISAFIPGLDMFFHDKTSLGIAFELDVAGSLESIILEKLFVDSDGLIVAEIEDANLKNLLSADSLYMDISKLHIKANPAIVLENLPAVTVPKNLDLPQNLDLNASIKGFLNDFYFDAAIESDFASLAAGFTMKQEPEKDPEWDFFMQLVSDAPLAVTGDHKLIRDLHLSLQAGGRGFDINTMMADALLVIDSVCFNHYDYKNLEIKAFVDTGMVSADIDYDDEHLQLILKNSVNISTDYPHIMANWNVKHLNAIELGFTDELIALQTGIQADIVLNSADFFDGSVRIDGTHVLHNRDVYSLDSLVIITQSAKNSYSADIYSPLIEARYRGNISPAEIPVSLAAHLNNYLNSDLFVTDTVDKRRHFQFSMRVMPSPYYTEIILPQLNSFEPLSISAIYDSDTQIISLDADIPDIDIMGLHLHGLQLKADSDPEYLDFSLLLPEFNADPLSLTNIAAEGHLADRKFLFDLSFDDQDQQPWLGMSGRIRIEDEHTQISFDEMMMVNRFFWEVEPGNFLLIGKDHIAANNLKITADDKEFAIASADVSDKNAPLDISLKNIDLGSFDLIGGSPVVEGLFNGNISVFDVLLRPSFTADLTIDALGYQGESIGDVHLLVNSPEPGLFIAEASLSGYGNIVNINGLYRQDDEPFLNFDLRLDRLDIATLEAMTFEELRNMEGLISGNLSIKGSPDAPDINGAIHFKDVGFLVSFLNVHYQIPDETVMFTKNMVRFDEFTLLDRSDRPVSLDGSINYEHIGNILFDLRLTSSNFLIMDIPRGQNELFFGRLFLDSDIAVRGKLSDPVIDGSLKLNEGSSLALFVPQTAPEAIGDEGIVEFISISDELFADLLLQPDGPEPMMSSFGNIDISVNAEIDRQTQVTIIVDEHAGDYLEIRGGGMISYGVDPGGRISLAGRYEITEGAYQMTFYDVIRRNFSIESGSHIIWTGDPLDATVDISARYSVRTSARELMATHGLPAGQQEPGFRRQYPFDVFLHMKGELMNPDISFELGLPPEHRGAMDGRLQARLNEVNQNESELNKQVFALLILGNFIQDDPLAAVTGGPGISATARTSASRLLSQQLNRLSDRYIRGIDLSFEIESFEEFDNGQVVGRTELQMEVSRDFFDQRLRITAGGHIELEDETRRQLNPADIAGDFSVEYLLLPDGRLILKVYRERNYQDIFDGELVETGISLKFRQAYNRFRELFRRRDDETGVNNEINVF